MEPQEQEKKSAGTSGRSVSEMPSGRPVDPRNGHTDVWLDIASAEMSAVGASAHHDGYRQGLHDAFRLISILVAAGIATYIVVSRQEALQ